MWLINGQSLRSLYNACISFNTYQKHANNNVNIYFNVVLSFANKLGILSEVAIWVVANYSKYSRLYSCDDNVTRQSDKPWLVQEFWAVPTRWGIPCADCLQMYEECNHCLMYACTVVVKTQEEWDMFMHTYRNTMYTWFIWFLTLWLVFLTFSSKLNFFRCNYYCNLQTDWHLAI